MGEDDRAVDSSSGPPAPPSAAVPARSNRSADDGCCCCCCCSESHDCIGCWVKFASLAAITSLLLLPLDDSFFFFFLLVILEAFLLLFFLYGRRFLPLLAAFFRRRDGGRCCRSIFLSPCCWLLGWMPETSPRPGNYFFIVGWYRACFYFTSLLAVLLFAAGSSLSAQLLSRQLPKEGSCPVLSCSSIRSSKIGWQEQEVPRYGGGMLEAMFSAAIKRTAASEYFYFYTNLPALLSIPPPCLLRLRLLLPSVAACSSRHIIHNTQK